ncbi:Protein of unknown function, partial [Gryllus bimaculatus]
MAHAVSSCHVLFVTICHYSLTRASEHDSFLGAIAQRVYCCVTRVTVKVSSQWLSLAVSRGQVEGNLLMEEVAFPRLTGLLYFLGLFRIVYQVDISVGVYMTAQLISIMLSKELLKLDDN